MQIPICIYMERFQIDWSRWEYELKHAAFTIPTGAAWRRPARLPGHRPISRKRIMKVPLLERIPEGIPCCFPGSVLLKSLLCCAFRPVSIGCADVHPITKSPECKDKMYPHGGSLHSGDFVMKPMHAHPIDRQGTQESTAERRLEDATAYLENNAPLPSRWLQNLRNHILGVRPQRFWWNRSIIFHLEDGGF